MATSPLRLAGTVVWEATLPSESLLLTHATTPGFVAMETWGKVQAHSADKLASKSVRSARTLISPALVVNLAPNSITNLRKTVCLLRCDSPGIARTSVHVALLRRVVDSPAMLHCSANCHGEGTFEPHNPLAFTNRMAPV